MSNHFVNTHCHTAFSLLDSIIRIPELVDRAVELGQKALAITDHGTLAGAVKFTDACRKKGIKPLLGEEFYISPDSRFRKHYPKGSHYAAHLILFAKNEVGWENLIKLSTKSFMDGFYMRPRIDHELLYNYSEGIIATSACIGGVVATHLKGGMNTGEDSKVPFSPPKALMVAKWFEDLFEDDFYYEMQSYGKPYQEQVNAFYRANFPHSQLMCSSDCHYLLESQHDTHDTLIAAQSVAFKWQEDRWRFPGTEFWLKSEQEVLKQFYAHEVYNTGRLADKITFELPLRKTFYMPELPEDITGIDASVTFVSLALDGIYERLGMRFACGANCWKDGKITIDVIQGDVRYAERLAYELSILIEAKYVEYFLLLHDLKDWCREEDILTGPGRGSGGGSLVLYALWITDIDPIHRDCPFERFLNPGRIANFSPPDVDLDFPQSKRKAIIEYLRETYGRDYVCQIGTYASLGPAALIKKLAVPLGLAREDCNDLTAAIPLAEGSVQGRGAAGDIGSSETLDMIYEKSAQFARKISKMGRGGELLMHYARGMEYLGSHAGTHASGLIITNRKVESIVPLMMVKSDPGEVMSQMDMSDVEALGLVKYDILGLKELDVLAYVRDMIRKNHNPNFSFEKIDMDDPHVFELLGSGHSVGLFQAKGGGLGGLLPQAQPHSIDDLAILNSLCRPGPMQAGITKAYIERKHGRAAPQYLFPQLEAILGKSYGCMCFQEDIMRIANECAGYTMAEADDMRKIMGKKQRDKMPAQQAKFIAGVQNVCNIDPGRAEMLWAEIEHMSEYVFNRAHSIGYSYVTFWGAWAKRYYPSYFFAGAMTSDMLGTGDELPGLLNDARWLGVTIGRPDINDSMSYYAATSANTVRVGLQGIKGVGDTAVAAIIEERTANGPFRSREDLRERIPARKANSAVMTALEAAGAFDQLDGRVRRVTVESLLEEQKLFGFFMSGHPCERLRIVWTEQNPTLSTFAAVIHNERTTPERKKTQHGWKNVLSYPQMLVRGVVTKYDSKKSKSKAGQYLYFFDVEDETGFMKVMLKGTELAKLGIESITKGMGVEMLGSKSMRPGRKEYFEPTLLRAISFTA